MSNFDIRLKIQQNTLVNVSLTEPMEEFVRRKVAVGEYETNSEVIREALRLLRHRDEVWKNEIRHKIKVGMDSIRAGRVLPSERVKTEMTVFKKKWSKSPSSK